MAHVQSSQPELRCSGGAQRHLLASSGCMRYLSGLTAFSLICHIFALTFTHSPTPAILRKSADLCETNAPQKQVPLGFVKLSFHSCVYGYGVFEDATEINGASRSAYVLPQKTPVAPTKETCLCYCIIALIEMADDPSPYALSVLVDPKEATVEYVRSFQRPSSD